MKKDIEVPQVKHVFVAVVHETHEEFGTKDWNAYIINNNSFAIETVLIVSKGLGETNNTSTLRHTIEVLPAKSYAKIEFLQDDVVKLENEFSVSFFSEGKLLHKKFTFEKGSIVEENTTDFPVIPKKGILAD